MYINIQLLQMTLKSRFCKGCGPFLSMILNISKDANKKFTLTLSIYIHWSYSVRKNIRLNSKLYLIFFVNSSTFLLSMSGKRSFILQLKYWNRNEHLVNLLCLVKPYIVICKNAVTWCQFRICSLFTKLLCLCWLLPLLCSAKRL